MSAASYAKRPPPASFALLVGQHALTLDRRTFIKDHRDAETAQRIHVALFLYYIRNFCLENKDEFERLKTLPNLEEIIQIRFVRLLKTQTETYPYRQMFYVFYGSSNEIMQSLERRLSHCSSLMLKEGLMYVANPGSMPAADDRNFHPFLLVGHLHKLTVVPITDEVITNALRQFPPSKGTKQTLRTSSAWQHPSSNAAAAAHPPSSSATTQTHGQLNRPQLVDASRNGEDESDDPIVLSTPGPASERFAVIISKFIIDPEQCELFFQDANKLYRFWTYIKDFAPPTFASPLAQTNGIHEIEVENKLINLSAKSNREIFIIRAKGGRQASPHSRAATMELKKHLQARREDLKSGRGIIFLGIPGAVPAGHYYSAVEKIMHAIRSVQAHSIPYDLLPKKSHSQAPSLSSTRATAGRHDTPGKSHPSATSARQPIPVISSSAERTQDPGVQALGPSRNSMGKPPSTPQSRPSNAGARPINVRPVNDQGYVILSSDEDTVQSVPSRPRPPPQAQEPIEISDDDEPPPIVKPPEVIDLTADDEDYPPPREVPLPDTSIVPEVIAEETRDTAHLPSPAAEGDAALTSHSDMDEQDLMDLDSAPEIESTAEGEFLLSSETTEGPSSTRSANISLPLSPLPFHSASVSPEPDSVLEGTGPLQGIKHSAFSPQQHPSSDSIHLFFREEEDSIDVNLVLQDIQEFLPTEDANEEAFNEGPPGSPMSASEVTTDLEENGELGSEDAATGCSEWAKRMAAEMKEADARKYLQRARKYHRDELDSSFTDRMRDRPIEFQRSTYNRDIYESWILQSTLDEPNAPPIGVKNTVDEEPCPEWEYFYTNKMIRGDGVPKPLSSNKREGCSCIGGCYPDINICACAARQEPYNHAVREDLHGFLYNEHGQLQEFQLPVFECNDACSCAEYCHNRVAQRGRQYAIDIRKTVNRGWGVFAAEFIPKGTFLGIYSGELLLDMEAEIRAEKFYDHYHRTYLFDIDCYYIKDEKESKGKKYRSKYTIDAMYAGCFTRFLNHACYPNCHIVPCLFGDADFDIPYLAFYTRIPIQKDEEITFSYKGYTDVSPEEEAAARKRAAAKKLFKKVTQKPGTETRIHALCQCGSWNCNGSMFKTGSEDEEETDSELEGLPSEDSEP